MRLLLFIVLLVSVLQSLHFTRAYASTAPSDLKLSIVISRHGDRTPLRTFVNTKSEWPEGLGSLTKIGERQLERLGKYYRERYVDKYKLVPGTYNDDDVLVRSTGKQRTLLSAFSFMVGFYPPTGKESETGLSFGIQPVPIYSEGTNNDFLLYGYKNCPRMKILREIEAKKPYWQQKIKEGQKNLEILSKMFGEPIEIQDVNSISNICNGERIHKRPTMDELVNNTELYKWVVETGKLVLKFKFPTQEIGVLGTGKLFSDIVTRMEDKLAGNPTQSLVYYSAHDGLILALLAALKLDVDVPPYASHFTFELWKKENGIFVNTLYNEVPVRILGCDEDCSFDKFSGLLTNLQKEYPFSPISPSSEVHEHEDIFPKSEIIHN